MKDSKLAYSSSLPDYTNDSSENVEVKSKCSPSGLVESLGAFVNRSLQSLFGKLGHLCATHPWKVILAVLLLVAASSCGLILFELENRVEKLWVPKGSRVLEDLGFYSSAFASEPRSNRLVMVSSENTLNTPSLERALMVHADIVALEAFEEGRNWNFTSLCLRDLGGECEVDGLLSLWDFDLEVLRADADVLGTVNAKIPLEKVDQWLGGITRDQEGGPITSATALRTVYMLENRARFEGGSLVDPPAKAWEGKFLDYALTEEARHSFELHPEAERSFEDEFGDAVQGDMNYLIVSFGLIMIYLLLVLGEFSRLRSRVLLATAGLLSIGFAIATSFGLSSLCGFKYNYVHSVMPFLLLAVGVDNIFIIVNALADTNELKTVPERASEAMAHAGVSITITSLTNFTAFIIGTTTSLPALTSFCFYTASAILALYVYQITFFCACACLDERRIERRKMDCCLCVSLSEKAAEPATKMTKRALLNLFMERVWARVILHPVVKVISILAALGLMGFSIYGILQLEIQDALTSFIPKDSYVVETMAVEKDLFDPVGTRVEIVTMTVDDYFSYQAQIGEIGPILDQDPYVQRSTSVYFDSWYVSYLAWLSGGPHQGELDPAGRPATRESFYLWLEEFLQTEAGLPYQADVVFLTNSTTFIRASRVHTAYLPLEDAIEQVRAMNSLRETCEQIGIPSFPWAFEFITWEQNAVVSEEIYVNLGLSFAAIFVITFVLIANPLCSLLVLGSVVMTIVDIVGIMYFWGLALDSVTAVNLVLAVGFSVDYTAHIAHSFMLKRGTRSERVTETLGSIGISVLNGAISTFLAILVLSFSSSYVFVVFFKQFFLVCLLGVFHGMVVLPIVLSLIGPKPYKNMSQFEASDY